MNLEVRTSIEPTEKRARIRSQAFRGASAMVAVVAVAAALIGCSQSPVPLSDAPVSEPSASYTGAVPDFSGPWAEEFAEAYRSTTSGVVHKILAKGSVTDRDYATVSRAYVKCMAKKGFDVHITGQAGQGMIDGEGDTATADRSCNEDMAVISALRFVILQSPRE